MSTMQRMQNLRVSAYCTRASVKLTFPSKMAHMEICQICVPTIHFILIELYGRLDLFCAPCVDIGF
jgi:hypothetical protein